jgi:hypothetical protein
MIIAIVQWSMMTCLFTAILNNENDEFSGKFSASFALFYVKLHCAIALHLFHYPEILKGLQLMKFANNEREQFCTNGSEIAFCVGLI